MITAKFTVSNYNADTKKWVESEVIEEMIAINLNYNGEHYTFYTKKSDLQYVLSPKGNGRGHVWLYNADGSYVRGMWRHGRTGSKVHIEGVQYSVHHKRIVEVDTYQNGRKKDSYKYFLGLVK